MLTCCLLHSYIFYLYTIYKKLNSWTTTNLLGEPKKANRLRDLINA